MKRPFYKFPVSAARARSTHLPLLGLSCAALALFLFSCGSIPPAHRAVSPGEDDGIPPRYSIVCIIHGDDNYVYHDADGNAHKADQVTLAKATMAAERNRKAEVFIFHERRRTHRLFFFPRRDGTFYYYRHGRLIAEESYWRDQGQLRFDPEMELYSRFHAEQSPELVRLFLYFGHEIPEFGGAGYDASYKKRTFTVDDLAGPLERITGDSTKVDLVVLSTCFGGTPRTIAAVAPYARYVIASPDNLHLSYFDIEPLERLDVGSREEDVSGFANAFAQNAFHKLAADMQTAVSVVVYDVARVSEFLRSVDGIYDHDTAALQGAGPASIEHFDCAEDPAYALPGMSEGITVLYRPSRFGRAKNKESHSGWECWRLLE